MKKAANEGDESTLSPSGLISGKVAANLLMLSVRRLDQLVQEGWIVKHSAGKYLLTDVVQGYVRYVRDEARRATKSAGENRVRDARAKEVEVRTATKLRQLIGIDDAIASMEGYAGMVRAEFAGMPARITRDLGLRRLWQQEVDATFNRLADRLDAEADALRGGEADADDAELGGTAGIA
jgi:hypothetical protein